MCAPHRSMPSPSSLTLPVTRSLALPPASCSCRRSPPSTSPACGASPAQTTTTQARLPSCARVASPSADAQQAPCRCRLDDRALSSGGPGGLLTAGGR
eukprot:1303715-Prymnesium_polylepis.2